MMCIIILPFHHHQLMLSQKLSKNWPWTMLLYHLERDLILSLKAGQTMIVKALTKMSLSTKTSIVQTEKHVQNAASDQRMRNHLKSTFDVTIDSHSM